MKTCSFRGDKLTHEFYDIFNFSEEAIDKVVSYQLEQVIEGVMYDDSAERSTSHPHISFFPSLASSMR